MEMDRARRRKVVFAVLLLGWLLVAAAAPTWGQIPTEADVFVDRGILAYDGKQYQEALQALQEALKLDANNVNALYYLGLTHAALEQWAAAQQALEKAQGLAPKDLDVTFQLAVVYFNQQQYEKAEPLFRRIFAAQPKRQNVGYYLGFIEFRKKEYREALRFFQANVPSDANFAQLSRFYAGLSMTGLGLMSAARAEIEEAIRIQPVSPLRGPAEQFRDVLGAAVKAERNWRLETKFSFFYDDNVRANPTFSDDPAVRAAREKKSRTTGELAYVRFEYQPLRTPDWDGTVGAAVLGSYNNDVTGFSVGNLNLAANLGYKSTLAGRQALWNLGFYYDYISLDYMAYTNRYTLAPAFTYVWGPNHVTQLVTRLQGKDYMNQDSLITTADNRDATNYMAGFTHFLLFEGGRHYLKAGYQFDYDSAQGENWSYVGNRFLAGFQYVLPWWELRFRGDFDIHLPGYTNRNTLFPITAPGTIHRWDRNISTQVSLAKDLPRNITVAVEYSYNRNISNLAVFDYDRNVVSLSVSWKY